MTTLVCRRWSEQEFLSNRAAWNALRARSDGDPLFMSWEWQHCWWRRHAQMLAAELIVLAVETPAGDLVGLAPFFAHASRHAGLVRTRRLELIGNAWRLGSVIFSEYLDVLADGAHRAEVAAALQAQLAREAWDEIVFSNVRAGSFARSLAAPLAMPGYARQPESMTAWSIALPASFDAFAAFAASLESNTRRKLLHQRAKLPQAQFIELDPSQWPGALERLEQRVAVRWKRAQDPRTSAFHGDIAGSLPVDAVRLTELRSGSQVVSTMFNIRMNGTEYYLQSAFDGSFARGLSPGYLHLGYAIEAACRDGLARFDLLAGRGLHRDYKRDLAAVGASLTTVHLLRHPALRALFRAADLLRGRTDITSRA